MDIGGGPSINYDFRTRSRTLLPKFTSDTTGGLGSLRTYHPKGMQCRGLASFIEL